MPIEIRELHIRVAVDAGPAHAGAAAQGPGAPPAAGGDKDALVAECVDQVMAILQSKKER